MTAACGVMACRNRSSELWREPWWLTTSTSTGYGYPYLIHNNRANMAFFDGHVNIIGTGVFASDISWINSQGVLGKIRRVLTPSATEPLPLD